MNTKTSSSNAETEYQATTPQNCNLTAVASDGTAWCATDSELFLFSPDNGWESQLVPSGFDSSYYLAAADNGCAYSGNSSSSMQYFDGNDWSTFGNQPPAIPANVATCNDGTIAADGGNGTIYFLAPNTTDWVSTSIKGVLGYLVQLSVVDVNQSFALDDGYNIFIYQNSLWSVLPTPSSNNVISLSAGSDGFAIAVDSTTLWFYDPEGTENVWDNLGDSQSITCLSVGSKQFIWGLLVSTSPYMLSGNYDPSQANQVEAPEMRPKVNPIQWDTESPYDQSLSTHLWIVYQAATLAAAATGNYATAGNAVSQLITPAPGKTVAIPGNIFHNQLCQGLYDADFLAQYNNELISGVLTSATYKSHFYDPATGENWRGDTDPTALTNGLLFATTALEAYANGDMSTAGYNLGLALHYLTDLTQPMHSSNYTYLSSTPWGFHSDYETSALTGQYSVSPPSFISLLLDADSDLSQYYITAATNSKPYMDQLYDAAYNDWWNYKTAILNSTRQKYLKLWHADVNPYWNPILQQAITVASQFMIAWYQQTQTPGWEWLSLGYPVDTQGYPVSITLSMGNAVAGVSSNVFGMGSDGNLWGTYFSNGWQPWSNLGQPLDGNGNPVTITQSLGAIQTDSASYVVGLGNDGNAYECTYQNFNDWVGWSSLGQPVSDSNPVSIGVSMGLIMAGSYANVLAMGSDGNLWTTWYANDWNTWASLGQPNDGNGNPVTITTSLGAVETNGLCYIAGMDIKGNPYVLTCDNGNWQGWAALGVPSNNGNQVSIAVPMGAVVVGVSSNILVMGSDGNLYTTWYANGWNTWASLGQPTDGNGNPVTISQSLGNIQTSIGSYIAGIGDDGNAYVCTYQNNNNWLGWSLLEQPAPSVTIGISLGVTLDTIAPNLLTTGSDGSVWSCLLDS